MIRTVSTLDVHSTVEAARQSQQAMHRMHFDGCPHCGRALSIEEVIEHHCQNCEREITPMTLRYNNGRAA
ncbi:hypothetical protein DTW90_36015 [Neorhizobium sp. P12A]|uniref:hypothetical protein n=1 Tax=Neorhizobium sp. P12A TaxID=2268027 RepID=UPI0011EEE6C1|nr:hypothetical protein [Neorhizobium sp. P12A]KAA0684548.1 hypothetical protein DTW90_36015 [Neorhizobium sp. P12A]